MALKKVKGKVTFKKGGSVSSQKHEIELLVPYPWKGGAISNAFKVAVEESSQCPSSHTVNSVSDVVEV
jgi:hypothetical protein